jgi:hypothetical protein
LNDRNQERSNLPVLAVRRSPAKHRLVSNQFPEFTAISLPNGAGGSRTLREVLSKIDVGPMLTENEVAATIVDVAYHIHRQLGSGLLESVYHSNMKLTRVGFRKPEELTQSRKAAKKKNANREFDQSRDSTRLPSTEPTSRTNDSLRDPFCVFA